MYKYNSLLDNPDKFKTYLKREVGAGDSDYHVKSYLPTDFLKKYQDLFKRLDILDKLIMGHNEKFFFKALNYAGLSYENRLSLLDFFILGMKTMNI